MRALLALACLGSTTLAHAAPADGGEVGDELEIVVTDQPLARWDGTRWQVRTQVGLPYPVVLYAGLQHELQIVAYDASVVLACTLGESLSARRRDVDCLVEDASISAAPWLRDPPRAAEILGETSERLRGLVVRLQVTTDGRVDNVTLVGDPQVDRRTTILYENLRQILLSAVAGFHLVAPEHFVLGEQWTERNSALFRIPLFRFIPGGVAGIGDLAQSTLPADDVGAAMVDARATTASGTPTRVDAPPDNPGRMPAGFGRSRFDTLVAPAALATSIMAHRMDPYEGRYVVQSTGEGALDIGRDAPVTFRGTAQAVSVYRPQDAVMTERVWTVNLKPTPGSVLALGSAGWEAWTQGSLTLLGAVEEAVLPPPSLYAPPHGERGMLPPWPSL